MFCDTYKGKPLRSEQHAEDNNLCFNCLGRHKLSECDSKKTCAVCNARHHITLHDVYSGEVVKISHLAKRPADQPVAVLLTIARVCVLDRFGAVHTARVDQGSETSLVTEALVQCLKLPRSNTAVAVFDVGGKWTGCARRLVMLEISPRGRGPSKHVSALILSRITLYDGGLKVNRWA